MIGKPVPITGVPIKKTLSLLQDQITADLLEAHKIIDELALEKDKKRIIVPTEQQKKPNKKNSSQNIIRVHSDTQNHIFYPLLTFKPHSLVPFERSPSPYPHQSPSPLDAHIESLVQSSPRQNHLSFASLSFNNDDGFSSSQQKGGLRIHPYTPEIDNLEITTWEQDLDLTISAPPSIETTPLVFVETLPQLEAMIEHLQQSNIFAVDVEHHSQQSYRGQTCLIQISSISTDFIIDPLSPQLRQDDCWSRENFRRREALFSSFGMDQTDIGPPQPHPLSALNTVFADPAIIKVFHGSRMDIQWLQRDFGVYVVNLYDSYEAAKLIEKDGMSYGIGLVGKKGLDGLIQEYVFRRRCPGVSEATKAMMDRKKEMQREDWRVRPMSEDKKRYARQDTHFLLWIWKQQMAEIRQIERAKLKPQKTIAKEEKTTEIKAEEKTPKKKDRGEKKKKNKKKTEPSEDITKQKRDIEDTDHPGKVIRVEDSEDDSTDITPYPLTNSTLLREIFTQCCEVARICYTHFMFTENAFSTFIKSLFNPHKASEPATDTPLIYAESDALCGALFGWRDGTARKEDLSPGEVMSNRVLTGLMRGIQPKDRRPNRFDNVIEKTGAVRATETDLERMIRFGVKAGREEDVIGVLNRTKALIQTRRKEREDLGLAGDIDFEQLGETVSLEEWKQAFGSELEEDDQNLLSNETRSEADQSEMSQKPMSRKEKLVADVTNDLFKEIAEESSKTEFPKQPSVSLPHTIYFARLAPCSLSVGTGLGSLELGRVEIV
ncbi:putative Exosome complex exonuclease rrp6 [Blattamonas nauphoetae]|uniref:Exosome complex exonuclease rrp6 n=1 Tax=Blattamonas nauphoetae TaxID=2049346 RepID=A0ABQ9XLY0_9EUKA|nr:putative Exosome complex exonuclease rrp6 [Blattamonas nauphoetae]